MARPARTDPYPPQTGPKWGSRGGPKKGTKLSRLGELLNTQKNVHFFAPPGGRAPGGPPGGLFPYRGNTPPGTYKMIGKKAQKWPILGPPGGPGGGPGGAPGAPPGGRGKFPGPPARPGRRGAPGRGPREGVSPRSYKQWPVRRGLPVLRASVCTASSRFGHLRDRSQVLRDPTRITRSEVERSKHTAGRELGGGLG